MTVNVTPATMPGAPPRPPRPREDPGAIPPPPSAPPVPDEPIAPLLGVTMQGAPERRGGVPIYGVQYIRREAVRLAIESYADEERPSDEALIATADRIAEFIRSGNIKQGH